MNIDRDENIYISYLFQLKKLQKKKNSIISIDFYGNILKALVFASAIIYDKN